MPNNKYMETFNRQYLNKAGEVEDPAVNEAERIAAERGNVEETSAAFETDVEGQNYQFNPFSGQFEDYGDFYPEGEEKIPTNGDMVASNDGFLYAYVGPAIANSEEAKGEDGAGLQVGWYKSQGAFHGDPA